MRDLYSTLHYKIGFTIESKYDDVDLLWVLVLSIKKWQTKKFNGDGIINLTEDKSQWSNFKAGKGIEGNAVSLSSEFCIDDEPFKGATFWACKIVEFPKPDEHMASRRWITEIGFKPLSPGKADFSCVNYYSDAPGFLGECQKKPKDTCPNLIKILRDNRSIKCSNGIDPLNLKPCLLKNGDFKDFWERIKNKDRSIPYIYVSPNTNIDPKKLADALGGNAIVYYAIDPEVSYEMDYVFDCDYLCYNGSVRVYLPQVDDPTRHRFFSRDDINRMGSDQVIHILRRAIAQNSDFYYDFFRTEDCRNKREAIVREKRIKEILEKRKAEKEAVENSALAGMQEFEDNAKASDELSKIILEQNDDLKKRNSDLQETITRLQQGKQYKTSDTNDAKIEFCDTILKLKNKEPKEIVEYLWPIYKDKIAFTQRAIKSLKECKISFDELLKSLHCLATVMHPLYLEENAGDIYKRFHETTGIEATRGEGSQTRNDKGCMDQRKDVYNGNEINIEPHLKLSQNQRIHFAFSKEDKKIVIGWCAGHLDTSATKKLRKM